MPKYTDEDYRKFLASAPTNQREYRTIELSHPDFSAPLYLVQDQVNRVLGGQAYEALPMDITEPAEQEDADQVLTVALGAVSNEVQDIVSEITAAGYFTPVSVIYRKFYSADISTPVLTLSLSIGTLNFNSYSEVSFTAEDTDFINKSSGEIYTTQRFPTMTGI